MSAREAWGKAWDVNVIGAYAMTSTFLPLLIKSSDPRLLFVTSGLSSIKIASDSSHPRYQNPPAGWPKQHMGQMSYKSAKAGLNMMMVEWHRILKNDGVKVWSIAPGLLVTGLGGNREALKALGAGDPSIGEFLRLIRVLNHSLTCPLCRNRWKGDQKCRRRQARCGGWTCRQRV